ncbi:MAG: hypothetical protein KDC95_12640, partial [Planctomycetes bacterium]|nr:hypothetical protein [Planctomycetota bacterium]
EPTGRAWQRSSWHEFVVTDSGAPRQDVVLQATVERVVRVARADGERIEGTRVQLVESPSKAPIDTKTPVYEDIHSMYMPAGSIMGRLIDDEVTDEQGEVTLEGPGGTELALRVLGPGHVPVCQNDIVLDRDEGLIEIVVPGGARVVGTLGPVDLLERVWQQSGLPVGGSPSAAQASRAPGVRLMRKVGDLTEHIPVTGKQACEADGSFAIEGVPPGTWTLQLLTSTADRRMYSTSGVAVAQIAGLTDGETRKVDVDLTNHVQSTLKARVVLDGKAYADGLVTLAGTGPRDVSGQQAKTWSTVRTDSAGEFEQLVPPGQYHVTLQIQDPATNRWDQLAANESVIVNPGVPVTVTFVVQSATLRLAVRDSSGEKVTSVRIVAERSFDEPGIWLPEPDDEGVIHTRLPSGTWKLRVRRAEYMDVQKFRAFLLQHQGDANAWKLTMQDVREIQVASGGPAELRIDLPASAGF